MKKENGSEKEQDREQQPSKESVKKERKVRSYREAHRQSGGKEMPTKAEKAEPAPDSPLNRFARSMIIDYEKWHDGIGYDLEALGEASPDERQAIEKLLISSKGRDWRDIEALAELDTPRSKQAIREAFLEGDSQVRMAVISYEPDIVENADKTEAIIQTLRTGVIYGGLSHALDLVEEFHPPEVVEELFRGVQEREGDIAVNFAAMLLFIHGKAEEPFDWSQRPFLLRFNTKNKYERRQAFLELCQKLGVRPEDHAYG